ncbi:uncharacterized protein LY89DRAFT_730051 [Mollisia scopiformis]|uniref:Uncharacterized protein n=1 Tax=Mollisia scopiformis TaxID=149040 RepID=A0A194XM58_MOLSC|nr:uncharacterized protein LY89DRAFT_730051 [Mollisia scopiformis]KUJ21263.1 hypothetical protein LY89DRAFT_730051 [Mollisia scopiformis]
MRAPVGGQGSESEEDEEGEDPAAGDEENEEDDQLVQTMEDEDTIPRIEGELAKCLGKAAFSLALQHGRRKGSGLEKNIETLSQFVVFLSGISLFVLQCEESTTGENKDNAMATYPTVMSELKRKFEKDDTEAARLGDSMEVSRDPSTFRNK